MKFKKLLVVCMILTTAYTAYCQRTFLEGIDKNTINMAVASSIYPNGSGDIIVTNSNDGTKIHIQRVNSSGNTVWSTWLHNTIAPTYALRALRIKSVAYGGSANHWLISGYQETTPGTEEALLILLNDWGTVLNSQLYSGPAAKTHALDFIQSSSSDFIYVVGSSRDMLNSSFSGNGHGIVFKVDIGSLATVTWYYTLSSGNGSSDYDFAEDITYLGPSSTMSSLDKFFVSGSRNESTTSPRCRSLALFVDDNGSNATITDQSFKENNGNPQFRQFGADAIVDGNTMYYLWNDEQEHSCHIMPFDLTINAPTFANAQYFRPANLNGGFQIFNDPSNPADMLRVYGYQINTSGGNLAPFYLTVRKDRTMTPFTMGYTSPNGLPEWHPNDIYSIMPYHAFASPPQGPWETVSNYTGDFVGVAGSGFNSVNYWNMTTGPLAVDETHLGFGEWHCGEETSNWAYQATNYSLLTPVTTNNITSTSSAASIRAATSTISNSDCATVYMAFGNKRGVTGVEQNESTPNVLNLHPNPGQDRVTITGTLEGHGTISILDLNGKILMEYRGEILETHSIDISDLNSGVYLLEIAQDDDRGSVRLIKN